MKPDALHLSRAIQEYFFSPRLVEAPETFEDKMVRDAFSAINRQHRLNFRLARSFEKKKGRNFESDVFFIGTENGNSSEESQHVLKITKHPVNSHEHETYGSKLSSSALAKFVTPAFRATFLHGNSHRLAILQEKMPGAPLGLLDDESIYSNSELVANLIECFEILKHMLESDTPMAELVDIWGLETLMCSIGFDARFTHNILADTESGKVSIVDTGPCSTFVMNNEPVLIANGTRGLISRVLNGKSINWKGLGCKLASFFFDVADGRERMIERITVFIAKLKKYGKNLR
jgi:hypothetical protein